MIPGDVPAAVAQALAAAEAMKQNALRGIMASLDCMSPRIYVKSPASKLQPRYLL